MRSGTPSSSRVTTSSRCVWGSEALKTLTFFLVIAALTRGGDYRLFAAAPEDTVRSPGRFTGATGFAVSPSGVYYVLLGESDELLRLTDNDTPDTRIGGYGWGADGFDGPNDVAVPNDLEIYISDYGNDRVVKLDRSLGISSVFETTAEKPTFRFPLSVCVTGAGRVLIVDGEFGRVVEIDRDNRVSRTFGGRGSGPGALNHPVKVRTDRDSMVVVQDVSGLVLFDIYGNHLGGLTRGTTGDFITFDCGKGMVALLDSGGVRFYSPAGGRIGTVPLPEGVGRNGEEVVDLTLVGEVLSLLTRTRIIRLDLQSNLIRD